MTSQDKLSFRIVNGPSKFDLMISLFDGNQTSRRTVSFQLEHITTHIPVAITMIEQEDGSGESWNFKGQACFENAKNFDVKGYFSTKGRHGYLHADMEQFADSLPDDLSRDFTDLIKNARRM